ncbi:hypothetical protein K503DRAFT_769825 [Rhizopogon vinicolor AM-OR11-026]|uniref:F-box domain-containing protein n=1 Tax=Rhizopogon vinicolor AM-OR11-026 TaxID=1314800 RepID=A0A1B7N2J4_9AGAM|nr:hypothetical protein K503DRAFT_769825 [Rhizopogon vinicolor AM-OR11-026]
MMLPNELWLPIFEYLPPQSIRCVVLISKKFHAIAIRLLYKHLILTSPISLVAAHPLLSSIEPCPHALLLGISPLVFIGGRPVEQLLEFVGVVSFANAFNWSSNSNNRQPSRSHFAPLKDTYQPRFLADSTLYSTLLSHVASFTSLRELVFRGMLLPANFHSLIHAFPLLRVLAIEHCTLPIKAARLDLIHTSLPIESLSLIDIRSPGPPRIEDTDALRKLATAHTLRSLTYDHTIWVHYIFTDSTPCPPLTALDVKFPLQKDRPRVPNGFLALLEALPSLRTLILRNDVPALPLSLTAFPALRAFSGPFNAISSICSRYNILKLDIRDEAVLPRLYRAFEEVHTHLSGLQELALFVGDWDDEVMLAIVAHFPSLRKLQVRYARGGPSEDTILGMGSRTLHALPHLTSVHIFRIPLPSRPESVFEVNNRDDDTAYGAPGINDTYFGCIHEVDSEEVSGALKGSGLNSRQLSQGNDTIAYAEPLAQGTSTSISTMIEDDHVPSMFNLVYPPPDPFSTPPNAFSTDPAPDIPHDADTHLVECYHEVAHGASCHQCTTPMRRRCFERVTAAISAARSNFKYKRRAVPELEENLSLTTELFDEYTRELVIAWNRACPALRAVQLHPGWVWRRADPTDYWAARPSGLGIWGDVFG